VDFFPKKHKKQTAAKKSGRPIKLHVIGNHLIGKKLHNLNFKLVKILYLSKLFVI